MIQPSSVRAVVGVLADALLERLAARAVEVLADRAPCPSWCPCGVDTDLDTTEPEAVSL